MTGARPTTWMPMFWGDYARKTAHLSTTEHGAYLLLIGFYWTRGRCLPDDDARLARIARLTLDEWLAMREEIAEFFDVGDGHWRHERIEQELEKAVRNLENARRNGQKGGRPKKPSENPTPNPPQNPTLNPDKTSSPSPSPSPLSSSEPSPPLIPPDGGDVVSPDGDPTMDVVVPIDNVVAAVDAWNLLADEFRLPRCTKISKERRSAIGARLRENNGLDGWNAALAQVRVAPHLLGKNDRGWRCSIDFIAKASGFQKIIEGQYHQPDKRAEALQRLAGWDVAAEAGQL